MIDRTRFRQVVLALLLGMGACGPAQNAFPPPCPVPGLIRPTADLVRYRPGGQDISDLMVRARIADVGGTCRAGEPGQVKVTVTTTVTASRGPAFTGEAYDFPVFVAVMDGVEVVDKTVFALRVAFKPNIDNAAARSPEIEMILPVTPSKSAAAYAIISGFQLTPEEAAAARAAPAR